MTEVIKVEETKFDETETKVEETETKVEVLCYICQEEICQDADGLIDSLSVHKDKHKIKQWDHIFHIKCINEWCQHCYKINKAPNCPLCPDYKISKKHLPLREKEESQPVSPQPVFESPQHELAIRRLQGIPHHNTFQNYYDQRGIPIFLGIMVCIDNVCVLKYSNRSLNLDLNSSFHALRHTILCKSEAVYKNARGRKSNISHNLDFNNWIQWKYPTIKITDTHFGITPYCNKIGLFNEEYLDDTESLAELYVRYQILANKMIDNRIVESNELYSLRNICKSEKVLEWGPTGPDDITHYEYAFCNPENPSDVSAYGYESASYNSIAWITIHVKYIE